MPLYEVHYFDQTTLVEANDEAEAMCESESQVECDSIEKVEE